MTTLTWKTIKHKYGPPSKLAYLGKIVVGEVEWNVLSSKEATKPYKCRLRLPGINSTTEFVTEAEAMAGLQKAVILWLQNAGIYDVLCNIVGNAKLIPDPGMFGATDIYAVPMDDIEAAKKLIDQLKA